MKNIKLKTCLLCVLLTVPRILAAEEPIKIGFTLPMTGAWGEYGEAVRNGVSLAQRSHPESFKGVQFIFEDDRYDPKIALAAFHKLRSQDNVKLIIVWGNESCIALAPVAEKQRFPMLAFAQLQTVSRGRNYVIRMLPPISEYSVKTLQYLRGRGMKKFAAVKAEASFFNGLVDAFQGALQPGETLQIVDTFAPADADFRTTIAKLKKTEFDALGVYLVPAQMLVFFQQAVEQDAHFQIFGSTPLESKTLIEKAHDLMQGAVYSHHNVDENFARRYRAEFGNDIQLSYAAVIHDVSIMAAETMKSTAPDLSPERVIAAFTALPERNGVSGSFHPASSAEDGHFFSFEVVAKRAAEGGAEVVGR